MAGKILVIIFFILLYCFISAGFCLTFIGIHNPIHKFDIEEDTWDGSKSININTIDDKFFFFILFFI